MLSNLFTVFGQVWVLFCLIAAGFLLARAGLVQRSAVSSLSNLVLYAALPCTLISAFQLELTPGALHDFLLSLAAALGLYVLFFSAGHLAIRDGDTHRKRMMTLSSVISNCNFMGLPLQTAILGSAGVFYGSAYSAINPLFMWTVGIIYLHGGRKHFQLKKAVLNPAVFGTLAGLLLFLGGFQLPRLLNQGISYLGSMATPVPMVIIGIQLAHTNLRGAIRDKTGWLAAALRLLILPLLGLGVMYACGIRGNVLIATTIAASTPAGVILAMFDRPDSTLAAEMVSLQTLCSVITMPLVVSLAQTLA
jgi:predicted permease